MFANHNDQKFFKPKIFSIFVESYLIKWVSLGTPVSSTNNTDSHEITEILFNTITLTLFNKLPKSITR